MSLFDALRYPVSDCPTEAELKALPKDLYLAWIEAIDLSHYLAPYLTSILHSGTNTRSNITLLRKMISEYNDNI